MGECIVLVVYILEYKLSLTETWQDLRISQAIPK